MVSLVKGVGIGTAVGASIGALTNVVPRGINAAYKSAGIARPENGLVGRMGNELGTAYKPLAETMVSEEGTFVRNGLATAMKKAGKANPYDIADGNYGSAAGSLALVGAGKLAYSGGASLLKLNALAKEKTGQNLMGLQKTIKGGGEFSRLKEGMNSLSDAQRDEVSSILSAVPI